MVITSQLQLRAPRQHDLQRENDAFRELANHLATTPDQFLQKLVETVVPLCDADTVGISMEETTLQGKRIFRWVAMAGDLQALVGGTTPRDFSPCGVCVDLAQPLLMKGLDRAYPYFKEAPLPFVEALLVPRGNAGGPVGTLWIVAHNDAQKFAREDVRLMSCLAAFAWGAIRLKQTMLESQKAIATTQIASELAHRINNPLQGAMLAVDCAKFGLEIGSQARSMLETAETELARVASLSAELVHQNLLHTPGASPDGRPHS